MCVWFGSEERSATLSTWCVSTLWPAGRTMISCSILSFRGSSLTTTHRSDWPCLTAGFSSCLTTTTVTTTTVTSGHLFQLIVDFIHRSQDSFLSYHYCPAASGPGLAATAASILDGRPIRWLCQEVSTLARRYIWNADKDPQKILLFSVQLVVGEMVMKFGQWRKESEMSLQQADEMDVQC